MVGLDRHVVLSGVVAPNKLRNSAIQIKHGMVEKVSISDSHYGDCRWHRRGQCAHYNQTGSVKIVKCLNISPH